MGTYSLNFKPAGGTGTTKGLVAGSKHILYTDGSTMFDVLDDAGHITANGTLTVAGNVSFDGGDFIFNDSFLHFNFTCFDKVLYCFYANCFTKNKVFLHLCVYL